MTLLHEIGFITFPKKLFKIKVGQEVVKWNSPFLVPSFRVLRNYILIPYLFRKLKHFKLVTVAKGPEFVALNFSFFVTESLCFRCEIYVTN